MALYTYEAIFINFAGEDLAATLARRGEYVVIESDDPGFSYRYDGEEGIEFTGGEVDAVLLEGQSFDPDEIEAYVEAVHWGSDNVTYIITLQSSSGTAEGDYTIVLGGDPLPDIDDADDFNAFAERITRIDPVESGPFSPGSDIEFEEIAALTDVEDEDTGSDDDTGGDPDGQSPVNVITGDDTAENIAGTAGDDSISAQGGDDTIDAGAGNDSVYGGAGADSIMGGSGDDELAGRRANDTLIGGEGDDRLFAAEGDDLVIGNAGNDTLGGQLGDDELIGDAGRDILFGGGGDDTAFGGDDGDRLIGRRGDDQLAGENGDDGIYGGGGNDLIEGGRGDDVLVGQAGEDVLFGDAGDDVLAGNEESDTLVGGAGTDTVSGNEGADLFVLSEGAGHDILSDFEAGTDTIGLQDGITFADLTFVDDSILIGDDLLAVVSNVTTATLQASDFEAFIG